MIGHGKIWLQVRGLPLGSHVVPKREGRAQVPPNRTEKLPAWDRTHDWVLHHIRRDLTRLKICFQQVPPSIADLAAARRCCAQFRNMAAEAVRAAVGDAQVLDLGTMPSAEARRLIQSIQGEGLEVVAEYASFVGYLPYDRTTGCAWLIEDEAEASAVAQDMLASGIPVQDVNGPAA
jgi:hypothetical protein